MFSSKRVESPTTKIVGIIKRLRHEYSLQPRQGQLYFVCFVSMIIGSLSHVEEGNKDLLKDDHRFSRLGVWLEDSRKRISMVHHNFESS